MFAPTNELSALGAVCAVLRVTRNAVWKLQPGTAIVGAY